MKRFIYTILTVALLLCLCSCGAHETTHTLSSGETKIQDLADARIGLVTGSLQAVLLPKMLPDADFIEYNSNTDAAMALMAGKIDAFSVGESVLLSMQWEGKNIRRIDEPIDVGEVGMLFGNGSDPVMQEQFNAFLAKCKENGTLNKLKDKWFRSTEPNEMPDFESLNGNSGTLLIGFASAQKPYTYIKNEKVTGFDVELLTLFAEEHDYRLEFEDASFGGLLSGIEQGRYDIVCSGVSITEERQESMTFSDPYYEEALVLVVKENRVTADKKLDEFQNATLGVIDGSLYDGFSRELFPNARIDSYPSFNDLFQCVKQGKIDGFLLDIPNFSAVSRTDENLSYIEVPGYNVEIGIAFGKNETGERLQAQMNEYLAAIRADGTYDRMWEYWCADTEPTEPPQIPDFSANTEELTIVFDLSRKPFVYLMNNEYAGFEVELMYRFCQEYGYRPTFEAAQWTSGVAGLKDGKYDVVSCGIYMTEERKESVNFCDPYVVADVILVIYDESGDSGFFASLANSFEKTFIRENRWKLIVEGVAVTLLISFCSVLGGSVLGFGLYMLSRSAHRTVSKTTKAFGRVYSRLIAGTPALVILMLLFYVVFGKSDIGGAPVAILGFALIFGSFVYGHLTLTVEGVDRGQIEAAYALGYSRNRTFFRISLPQAMETFLPTYTGEIVGLIKATSVVGYIAVMDLTKMGDIIRSNTYEAMFPLVAVAIIYFFITWGAAALMGLVQKKTNARRRREKDILKGVIR